MILDKSVAFFNIDARVCHYVRIVRETLQSGQVSLLMKGWHKRWAAMGLFFKFGQTEAYDGSVGLMMMVFFHLTLGCKLFYKPNWTGRQL